MRQVCKISVTLHTASTDQLLLNNGIDSHIQWFVDTLNKQNFKDFELILVDCLYPEKRDVVKKIKSNFPIKYVPNIRNYWQNMGYMSLSSPKNSAILFSEGELIIQFDDAETFDENMLSVYWDYFQKGLLFHPVHQRPYKGRVSVDHRIEFIRKQQTEEYIHNYGSWLYAGTCFSLNDAIALNGFNERLDGQKSLQDCEFGCRLQAINKKFVTHLSYPIHIVDHIEEYTKKYQEIKEKSNYGFILANMNLGIKDWTIKIFPEYLDIISKDTNERMKNNKYTLTTLWQNCPDINILKDRETELNKYYDNYYT